MGAGASAAASLGPGSSRSVRVADGGSLQEQAMSIRQKKMTHLEKTRLVQTVETFTKLVYLNVDAAVSLGNFLSNGVGAEVFGRFLERESAEHLVALYRDLDRRSSPEKLREGLERFSALFPSSRQPENDRDDLATQAERAQAELIQELAKNMFPRFLCSSEYQKWRAAERSAYSAMFLRGSVCWSDDDEDASSRSLGNSVGSSTIALSERGEENIFRNMDAQEATRLLNSDSWLATLLARADSLPIGQSPVLITHSFLPWLRNDDAIGAQG